MPIPVLVGVIVGAAVRYAAKEAIEWVVDKAKDAAVQAIVEKAEKVAKERLLKEAREKCPTCDPEEFLKNLDDPCDIVAKNSTDGAGKYRGGSHSRMQNSKPTPTGTGRNFESHHIPPKSNYPGWKKLSRSQQRSRSNKWPAIVMDRADHKQTPSQSKYTKANPTFSNAYNKVQRAAFKQGGIMAAYLQEVAFIKGKFGEKYDTALVEAGAYAACISTFPKKYGLQNSSRKRK